MAQSKNSSTGMQCAELTELLRAFEKQNDCVISIELRAGVVGGKDSVELVAYAWNNRTERTEAPLLASVSVRCAALFLATLEAAILRLLYALDSQLAWGELGKEPPKSA